MAVEECTPKDTFERLQTPGAILLDVREDEERETVRISGSVNIPLGELPSRVQELNPETEIYCLCHVGQRSYMACEYLQDRGFSSVRNVSGGIINWYRSGLPTSRSVPSDSE